jgi:uncharacterized membrane protein
MSIARWMHLIGVTIWVGGMFFAHMALRPAVATLAPPTRLPLLTAILGRFFAWVNVAIAAILGSGTYLMLAAGTKAAPFVHVMTAIGVVMMMIYLYIRFAPMRRLGAAVASADWPGAGAAMTTIRALVATNLVLGFIVITVAVIGPSFA